LKIRRRVLLVAAVCFAETKNNKIFPQKQKRKKAETEKKKNMQIKKQFCGGCQGFL